MSKRFFRLLTELSSRKSISRITGAFAKSGMSRRLIPWFVRTYSIRTEEADKPVNEYASLNDFFCRGLKPGVRPVDSAPDVAVSPVDGLITGIGSVEDGLLLDVKGQQYTIDELLNRSPRAVSYMNGFFIVLYLSPSDYHRIHSPVSGTIVEKEAIPGRVYPVNDYALVHMNKVLSRNVRAATYIRHPHGEVALVKVGALNVSSIQYVYPLPKELNRGGHLGHFEFGSTVVLLFENGTFTPKPGMTEGSKIKMGEPLGNLHKKTDAEIFI